MWGGWWLSLRSPSRSMSGASQAVAGRQDLLLNGTIGFCRCDSRLTRYWQYLPRRGRNMTAQGIALGARADQPFCSPERVETESCHVRLCRPFRASPLFVFFPRAMPWADMFGPFGAEERKRYLQQLESGRTQWSNISAQPDVPRHKLNGQPPTTDFSDKA